MGSNDEEVFEEVKNILYTDSAVAGEAAGIALGLISVGSASEKTQELLTYAHDTQHEKVSLERPYSGQVCHVCHVNHAAAVMLHDRKYELE